MQELLLNKTHDENRQGEAFAPLAETVRVVHKHFYIESKNNSKHKNKQKRQNNKLQKKSKILLANRKKKKVNLKKSNLKVRKLK